MTEAESSEQVSSNQNNDGKKVFILLGVVAFACGAAYFAKVSIDEYKLNQDVAIRRAGRQDLSEIAKASLISYLDQRGHLPHTDPEGVAAEEGFAWQTALLPHLGYNELYQKIDLDQKWNSSSNANIARTTIPEYLTMGVSPTEKDGFGVSHYAANIHIINAPHPLKSSEITDGKTNTIFAFEVPNDFQPWMNPNNLRDPVNGIGSGPGQIGREGAYGCQVLFLGGNVRFLSQNMDPDVLKAMSTYQGGDDDNDLNLDVPTGEVLDIANDVIKRTSN